MLEEFYSQGVTQLNLFDDNATRQNSAKLMEVSTISMRKTEEELCILQGRGSRLPGR